MTGRFQTSMSLKPRKTAPRAPPSESATSALAGVIAHELNNIAVPLQGFAELAGQNAGASESLGNSLEEIKIASARIKSLAADLESLGEMTSLVEPVAIGDCMPGEAAGDQPELPRIDWRCSASTLIAVDRAHARRASLDADFRAVRSGNAASHCPYRYSPC